MYSGLWPPEMQEAWPASAWGGRFRMCECESLTTISVAPPARAPSMAALTSPSSNCRPAAACGPSPVHCSQSTTPAVPSMSLDTKIFIPALLRGDPVRSYPPPAAAAAPARPRPVPACSRPVPACSRPVPACSRLSRLARDPAPRSPFTRPESDVTWRARHRPGGGEGDRHVPESVVHRTLDLAGLDVPAVEITGAHDGPALTVIAGVHGCEYAPMAAVRRWVTELQPASLRGRVRAVPVLNLPAFRARSPFVVPE